MDRGPLDMLVQIVQPGKKDAVLLSKLWPEHTHHVTSENGWATTSTIPQFGHSRQRKNPSKEGQSWILHWDMASYPRQRGHPGRHAGDVPSRRAVLPPATKHVIPAALRRGRLPQLQVLHPGAGERHACPLRHRRLLRRPGHEQSMAAPVFGQVGILRSHGPLRREQGGGQAGWHRLRAGSNAEFREAVAEAAALHAHGELFSRHIEPEPAPEDLVEWAMAEASDDEYDAPIPDAQPEPELIDMPPAPATAPRMSHLER